MRVVDDHVEGLAGVDGFEAAGNTAHRLEALPDRVLPDPERPRRAESSERVLDVEPTLEPQPDPVERAGIGGRERDRLRQLLREKASVLVADVDDRDRPRLDEKESTLRLEVGLHAAMEIEVVLTEVGEHQHREADAVEPVED